MAAIPSSATPPSAAGTPGDSYRGSFAIMTSLFFLWGFMTVFNDILIPRFKEAFALTYFQAMLVQFAFFGAYFVGALLYFIVSVTTGDPIARIGYKNGVVLGLLVSALGSAVFWPAAGMASYPMFLTGLFVVGLGFALLQIAANPYVTILGPERTASSRLNLAQGFNSVGTTIGPLIGGWLIFQVFDKGGDVHGAESVKVPYLAFCIMFLALAAVFFFIHLPHIGEGKIERGAGALRYPHVVLGIIAIFMYVGGEVAVGSVIINFLGQKEIAGLGELEASKYVSIYWGGMLIGRFMGSVELSDMKKVNKQVFLVVIPVLAYLLLWVAKSAPLEAMRGGGGRVMAQWAENIAANWPVFRNYLPFIALCWLLFQFGKSLADRTLLIFMATVVVLLLAGMLLKGPLAMWCVVAVGLFTSIGWSNTFSLAIEGLGPLKSQASSLLVMAILGGALLPPLQGLVADLSGNLQLSFVVPMVAYAYVAFYGAVGHRIGRQAVP